MRRVASHSGLIFLDFMLTSLVEICPSYGSIRCLHLQVYPEHGGGRRFRNFSRFLRHYTASYAKRQQSSEAIAPTECQTLITTYFIVTVNPVYEIMIY